MIIWKVEMKISIKLEGITGTLKLRVPEYNIPFDVEYIYGFVWWGVCKQSRWRHSVTEPSEDSGYVLLWQRYNNNKMVAMRYYGNVFFCCWRCVYWACYRCILHLQQYSHRLNLLFLSLSLSFERWIGNHKNRTFWNVSTSSLIYMHRRLGGFYASICRVESERISPSCSCTLKGSGSFFRDIGVWVANWTALCPLREGDLNIYDCENLRQCL